MRLIDADKLCEYLRMRDEIYSNFEMADMIDEQPTVEPPTQCIAKVSISGEELRKVVDEKIKTIPQWIPCSERLPEDEALFIDKYGGEYLIGSGVENKKSKTGFSAVNEDEYITDAVAWMPLPEPYKE